MGLRENCECKFWNNNVFSFKFFPSVYLLLHFAKEVSEGRKTETERNHDKVIKQLKVKAVVEGNREGSEVKQGFVFDCAVEIVLQMNKTGLCGWTKDEK